MLAKLVMSAAEFFFLLFCRNKDRVWLKFGIFVVEKLPQLIVLLLLTQH